MSSNSWHTNELGQIAEIIDCPHSTPKWIDSGYLVIGTPNVRNGRLILDKARYTDEKNFNERISRGKPDFEDLILTREAPMGEVCIVPENLECCLGQRVVLVKPNRKMVFPQFLLYSLQSRFVQNQINAHEGAGSTVSNLRIPVIHSLKIPLPEMATQKRIAGILSALDEKIELNRQTNATLEAIAQAIFKEWFVHEEVTSDWELVALPEIIALNPRRYLKKDELAPYLDMANVPTEGHRAIEWREREFSSGTRFANGDTLLARITPCLENGKTAFVDFLDNEEIGWGSTEFIVLKPKPPLPPAYGYYLARSKELRKHATLNMVGSSGRQRVPTSSFDNFLIPLPPIELAEKFGIFAEDLMNMIRTNDNQSRTLAQIRDTLLPKLMRGEVVV
ncbi:MAG: restriction endonuclease subunit S [Ardenticatenaceae bacterium]|nr:restriction endonuclease subunit S [Ardenticatenaceae bacterium]